VLEYTLGPPILSQPVAQPSLMSYSALTYISVYTTLKERPLYNALIGLSWGIGAILGPVIGGAFADNPSTTWRWAFYINLPLAAGMHLRSICRDVIMTSCNRTRTQLHLPLPQLQPSTRGDQLAKAQKGRLARKCP